MSEGSLERKRQDAVDFILRKTNMTKDQILSFENQPLSAYDMLKYGIATEKVNVFD